MEKGDISRRSFIGAGAAALAGTSGTSVEHLGLEHLEHLGLDLWKCVIFRRLVCLLLFIC